MKKNSQSWFEAMLLLSSPHFHGKKAIAAFGAAGSLKWVRPHATEERQTDQRNG